MDPPYTATMNASLPSPAVYSLAGYSLVDHVGFSECTLVAIDETTTTRVDTRTPARSNIASDTVTPTKASTTDPVAPTVSPSSTVSAPKTSLNVGGDSAIVLASVFVIAGVAFTIWKILQYRKRNLNGRNQDAITTSDTDRPYLQQKGELDAEEKRKYELQAEERRYELTGDNQIREMTVDHPYEMSTQRTQELRGEEHLRELDGTEN